LQQYGDLNFPAKSKHDNQSTTARWRFTTQSPSSVSCCF
jgi:hypothetical protein